MKFWSICKLFLASPKISKYNRRMYWNNLALLLPYILGSFWDLVILDILGAGKMWPKIRYVNYCKNERPKL